VKKFPLKDKERKISQLLFYSECEKSYGTHKDLSLSFEMIKKLYFRDCST